MTSKSTGPLSEAYLDSIIENSPEIPFDTLTWDESKGKAVASSGKARIIDMGGRKIVVININGFHMPFYLSTGHGGKKDVTSGKWYPIFGIGEDGWLNKTSGPEINNYYGSPVLRQIAEALDRKYGDIRDDSSIPSAKPSGSHRDFINQDLNPTENEMADTVKRVKENITETKRRLDEAVAGLEDSSEDSDLFDNASEGFFNEESDEDSDLFDSATEGLFDNEDDSEVNEEEDEDDEDDFLFDDAEEGFFGEDEEEVEEYEEEDEDEEDNSKPSPKPKAQPKVDISLGETFNPTGSSSAVSATFNKLMIANRALWKEICPTFVALKQKAAELGIDVNSITTQEQFEGMLT